jgi:putative hydrolase
MFLWGDFHTHTFYSHGTGSIEENVEAAVEKGLYAIGISEHGPANIGLGPKIEDYEKMRAEIQRLRELYDIKIYLGCEANVISISGKLDIPEKVLDGFDYIMVGLHPLVWPSSFSDLYHLMLENMLAKSLCYIRDKVKVQNTITLINVMNNYKVDVITHPGLHLPIDTAELAANAAKLGTALEINAGHGLMTEKYVKIAKAHGAKFVIGSDAHHPHDVGNFKQGIQIAEGAGLTEEDIINAGFNQE